MNALDPFYKYLPPRFSFAVSALPKRTKDNINEIRLRAGAPASLSVFGENLPLGSEGVCELKNALTATKAELDECVSLLTGGSLYAYADFIKDGYIPIKEGGRAGISGKASVTKNGISFFEITSVNIRIPRFIKDFAAPLIDYYVRNGLCGAIVVSPPALGKTTFLKSLIYLLSCGIGIKARRVGVADERGELTPNVPLGLCDVISGVPKSDAITMLTRAMSPEMIVCDEISVAEAEAVTLANTSGVFLVASAHAEDFDSLLKNKKFKTLCETGAFGVSVKLYFENGYKIKITSGKEK